MARRRCHWRRSKVTHAWSNCSRPMAPDKMKFNLNIQIKIFILLSLSLFNFFGKPFRWPIFFQYNNCFTALFVMIVVIVVVVSVCVRCLSSSSSVVVVVRLLVTTRLRISRRSRELDRTAGNCAACRRRRDIGRRRTVCSAFEIVVGRQAFALRCRSACGTSHLGETTFLVRFASTAITNYYYL